MFPRYIKSSAIAKQSLKLKWRARSLANAKNLIRLQTNVKVVDLNKGDVVYREGDDGESMYMVDEEDGGKLNMACICSSWNLYKGCPC